MKHNNKINHLGRTRSHRELMLSNMAVSLITHKRIFTTLAKAKELRKFIEPLITKSKSDTTHSRRVVFSNLRDKYAIIELFKEISLKIGDRPGGYTRIIKTENRLGDNAQMCLIELVDYNELLLKEKDGKAKKRRRGRNNSKNGIGVGQEKRQKIFDYYVKNVNYLIDNKFVVQNKDSYICPICLKPYASLDEDASNPLTLEDAPPKSLGGTANILTCKRCNNTCGHTIDADLVKRMREIDERKFIPDTESKIQIEIGGDTLQAIMKVEKDGRLTIKHSRKNNNQQLLDAKMKKLQDGMVIDVHFLKSHVIPERLEYALLKTGYLLLFEKFGYSLILDKCYDMVREQLLHPEKRTYPIGFWFKPDLPKTMDGVYFVSDEGLECIFVLFTLSTGYTKHMFATFLPLPIKPIEEVVPKIKMKVHQAKSFPLTLYPQEQKTMDYLFNADNLTVMYKWIRDRQ